MNNNNELYYTEKEKRKFDEITMFFDSNENLNEFDFQKVKRHCDEEISDLIIEETNYLMEDMLIDNYYDNNGHVEQININYEEQNYSDYVYSEQTDSDYLDSEQTDSDYLDSEQTDSDYVYSDQTDSEQIESLSDESKNDLIQD